ncbi:ATPase domain-containing protein [Janthinobacterium agaricidamnosum]|uniref:non-specific serine/threonine protein kinase n=1 Tax=Janthinobacterium agaricidamnosum NBRC 102515 = DSM 9628 TaxID=1349767 RepID=W0VA59_9BURK|nr:ATPase domain-containing protein [Janthinobacterium agaricidamnosum]CDG84157.1 kaiA binding family protein [Janthinobacterium agaricidamnosum NBRC 102515 = DSM 9628]
MNPANSDETTWLSTGVSGLDNILGGGFTPQRLHLVEGEPGTGKTTLALQFLMAGARLGEACLYITLGETAVELRAAARSHGWDLAGIHIEEIITNENILDPNQQYTIFHPSEIELGLTNQRILAAIERYQPARLVLDSLSEIELLAENPLRYRRQVMALKQYLASRRCTTLFVDDHSALNDAWQVRSVAHCVVILELQRQTYGVDRRHVRIVKYRGVAFRSGAHDYKIANGGLQVFPRLVAAETRQQGSRRSLSSGIAALDELTGGGLDEGMSTLISGPPGSGKSSLAAQFVDAATRRGEACAMFLFEESRSNLLYRSEQLGMQLNAALAAQLLTVQQIDPAELTPGEFIQAVIDAAETGARIIVVDSLNGYMKAVPDERFLGTYLHELLNYLGQCGIATVLIGVQQSLLGTVMTTSVDASYVADNVIMLRYFEAEGEVRQAISVFKKRGSPHQRGIHRFEIDHGIRIGRALTGFRGILGGIPTAGAVLTPLADASN